MRVAVVGTGSAVPERVVSNEEVGARAGVDDAWIRAKTGIVERRWAAPEEATSDLAVAAGRAALEDSGLSASDVSYIIVATSTPDHPQPPTAALVQEALGAGNAAAWDMNAVCSGFVFATASMAAMLAGSGGYGLVIGADVYSRILDPADRRTVVLFGDGAGALVLGPSREHGHGVVASRLHTFGAMADRIVVPAGGSRLPLQDEHYETGLAYFTMQGRLVKEFVLERLPPLVDEFLAEAGVSPDDVDHLVPHQANGRMLDGLTDLFGLRNATLHRTVAHFGNTAAASVGITLDRAARDGHLRRGDLVLLSGYGGGMAAGLALVRW